MKISQQIPYSPANTSNNAVLPTDEIKPLGGKTSDIYAISKVTEKPKPKGIGEVSCMRSVFDPGQFTIKSCDDVIGAIKSPSYEAATKEVSEAYKVYKAAIAAYPSNTKAIKAAKERYNTLKGKLHVVCFNGTFHDKVTNKNFNKSSGLFLVDIDNLPDVYSAREDLITKPNIVLCFISPSGAGLKLAVRVDADRIKSDADFKQAYIQIEYIFKSWGYEIDDACKDVSRKCFLPRDPDAFSNPDADIYDLAPFKKKEPKSTSTRIAYTHTGNEDKYQQKCINLILNAKDGERHKKRLDAGNMLGGFVVEGLLDINKAEEYIYNLIAASDQITDGGLPTCDKEIKTIKDGYQHALKHHIVEDGERFELDNKKTVLENIKRFPRNPLARDIESLIRRVVRENPTTPWQDNIAALEKQIGELSEELKDSLESQLSKKYEDTLSLHSLLRNNHPVFDITKDDAAERMIREGNGIYYDTRGMGTGKSIFAGTLGKSCKRFGKKFGYIAHRISIIAKAARDLGLVHYKDIDPKDKNLTAIASCINSALQRELLSEFFSDCHCIVIDEVKQVFDHLVEGPISNRTASYDLLIEFLREVPVIYVADADMNDLVLKILADLGRPMYRIVGPEKKPTARIKYTDRNSANSVYLDSVEKGKKVIFQCDSVEAAKTALKNAEKVCQEGYKMLLVHGDNAGDPNQSAYLKDPNGFGKQYDLIILSPIVSSGFSIEVDYDVHIGVFSGQLSPTEIIQTLGRYRNTKDIILGLTNRWGGTHTPAASRLAAMKAANGDFKWDGKDFDYEFTDFDLFALAAMVERERACEHLANTTLLILKQKGYKVETMEELNSVKEIKGTTKEVRAKDIRMVVEAEDIDYNEYKALQNAASKTEANSYAMKKYECINLLGLDGPPTEGDVVIYDKGKIDNRLKNHAIIKATKADAKALKDFEDDKGLPLKDKTYAMNIKRLFASVMAILQGVSQDYIGSWMAATRDEKSPIKLISLQRYEKDRIKVVADHLRKYSNEADLYRLGKYTSLNPDYDARAVGNFLYKFGLKHKLVGHKPDGTYQITEGSVLLMEEILERRKQKGISIFNMARVWAGLECYSPEESAPSPGVGLTEEQLVKYGFIKITPENEPQPA